MSIFRSSFSIRKTKPRAAGSRAPFKFSAEELAREYGAQYQAIDARIGNQKATYDTARGEWLVGQYLFSFTHELR